MKYIATGFDRKEILLVADSEPNFNKAVIQYFKNERQINLAIRKYRVSENDLEEIQQRIVQEKIPFYEAVQLRN